MKKITVLLVILLMIAAMYNAFKPVTETRYNTYDKSVDCYANGSSVFPEGCGAAINPTSLQSASTYMMLATVICLIGIGFIRVISFKHRLSKNII